MERFCWRLRSIDIAGFQPIGGFTPDGWGYLQGRRDLNPRPSVLETGALPTELLPYINKEIRDYQRQVEPTSGASRQRLGMFHKKAPNSLVRWIVRVI